MSIKVYVLEILTCYNGPVESHVEDIFLDPKEAEEVRMKWEDSLGLETHGDADYCGAIVTEWNVS